MDKTQEKPRQLMWIFGPMQVASIRGVANGLSVPSVRLLLALPQVRPDVSGPSEQGLQRLAEVLGLTIARVPASDEAVSPDEMALRLWLRLMVAALGQLDPMMDSKVAGAPLLRHREGLFQNQGQPEDGVVLLWPTYWPDVVAPILTWSLEQWTALAAAGDQAQAAQVIAKAQASWRKLEKAVKSLLPPGLNPSRLLTAARTLGRPVQWLERAIMQIGHGRRARLLHSTLTDATPSLGVTLAKDKVRAARWLRQAGLPVPQHAEVADAEAAVAAAERLGWPVVVKPADRDRGDGARANLNSPELVRAAFAHASAISKRVLVEQHIAGHEYRLTVVNGELFWAHERVPASVTGDGQHSLRTLIEAENARRLKALRTDPNGWVPIQMDAENLGYLQENGRSLDDVPPDGEVVRLQRVPAATTGGGGQAYFDTIHPDNRVLAERAAQLLRLDIAGVDLIMPDITRSWREVGGAVTEVNAIPQVSIQTEPTLATQLLARIMPHSGRIPLLFVLAEGSRPDWLDGVVSRLEAAGLCVGLTTPEGMQIGENWIRGPRISVWDDIRALQMDPSVGAMVIISDGDAFLKAGLPFDAVDALVVQADRPQVLSLLSPYVRGVKLRAGQDWQIQTEAGEAGPDLTEALVAALLQAEEAYADPQNLDEFRAEALEWLQTWQDRIAQHDYDGARSLFDDAVVGFGTVSHRAQGLDDLVRSQWHNVWSRTRKFTFRPESVEVWPSEDGGTMTVAVQWTSEGLDVKTAESFERLGRATMALRKGAGGWRARHTHFSLNPVPERFLPDR